MTVADSVGRLERHLASEVAVSPARTMGVLGHGARDPALRRQGGRVWWATSSPDGPVTVGVEASGADRSVRVLAWGPGAGWAMEHAPVLTGVADTDRSVERDPRLRRFRAATVGMRMCGTVRVYEQAVATVMGQKILSADAYRSWGRLCRQHGSPAPGPAGDAGMFVPPGPDVVGALSDAELHRLGLERMRIVPIRALTLEAPRLERAALEGSEALARTLAALPRIGPWTIGWLQMRVCADPDAIPVGDLHLPSLVVQQLTGRAGRHDDAAMVEALEPWRGQRGRVVRMVKSAGVKEPKRFIEKSPNRMLLDGDG